MGYFYDRRAASADSLRAAKLVWADQLAHVLEAHLKTWSTFHGMKVKVTSPGPDPTVYAMYGASGHHVFLALATISMNVKAEVYASISVSKSGLQALESTNLLSNEDYDHHEETLTIDENAPMKATALAVSKWFSAHLDHLAR